MKIKEILKGIMMGLIYGALFACVLITTLYLITSTQKGYSIKYAYGELFSDYRLTRASIQGTEANIIKNITHNCEQQEIENQPNCIHKEIMKFYKYVPHNNTINKPDKFYTEGGVCRDVSVLYAAAFKKLGWNFDFVYPVEGHVYVTIRHDIPCEPEWNATTTTCQIYCNFNNERFEGCVYL